MLRLFFVLLLLMALAVVAFILLNTVALISAAGKASKGDNMPQTVQKIAYVALIVLMFGICAGAFGLV